MIQLRDAPQPCDWGHIHPVAPLPRCLSFPGTQSTGAASPWTCINITEEGRCEWELWICVSDELYGNRYWLFLKARVSLFIPVGTTVYLFSFLSSCTYFKCDTVTFSHYKQRCQTTALMNLKAQSPKMFIPFITSMRCINDIHHSIDRPEKIAIRL